MQRQKILLVEDEVAIRDLIRFSLSEAEQYKLYEAANTQEAQEFLRHKIPDIIVLDWMLPGKSGIDFIHSLKKDELTKSVPIIMLTAKAEEESKIACLHAGADDYVTKPFSPNELIARIKAVLRRGTLKTPNDEIIVGGLHLNTATHQVIIDGEKIILAPLEYRMIQFLMAHPNRSYTRGQLLCHVWGNDLEIQEQTVDVQIGRLRKLLKPYGYDRNIETVRGVGYRFVGEVL